MVRGPKRQVVSRKSKKSTATKRARRKNVTARKAAASKAPKGVRRESRVSPNLAPGKSRELFGLLLACGGLILALTVVTYYPHDPSLLYRASDDASTRNLIGPLGAHLAALGFGLFGLTILATPVLMLAAGVRRMRSDRFQPVFGRGFGVVALLVFLPALLALTVGDVAWRGIGIPSGGGIGTLLADAAQPRIGTVGSLLVFITGVLAAAVLLVQSTIGEVLGGWGRRAQSVADSFGLRMARKRERTAKARARRKVVDKQVRRAAERRKKASRTEQVDLPLRVTEKPGDGGFAVRKVASDGGPTAAEAKPQKSIAFPKTKGKRIVPPADLLNTDAPKATIRENELVKMGDLIRERFAEFGVDGTIEAITPGPVITVFEFQPAPGIKVSRIVNLQDDLALALKAESVRIDRLPGRSTLGVEVPNDERSVIRLGYLLQKEEFRAARSHLTMAVGVTMHGEPYYADLATMPHLLVAGATGAGKSVGLQSMITSILLNATREEVQFIFIDPKRVELGVYADIPHLKTEVVVDPRKAANALRWAVAQMERRYRLLAEIHVRSIAQYNKAVLDPEVQRRLALNDKEVEDEAQELAPLPYYVIVIDELADLMMVASSEVESAIARLAQMARAVGIHLIIATQRPSVDVLTGTIKANFPCRISYATTTRIDSRTILDQSGAEQLLGQGDALFMPPGSSRLVRVHGAYISEQETAGLIRWLKKVGEPDLDMSVLEDPTEDRSGAGGGGGGDNDPLYEDAARLVVSEGMASASFLQRRMRVGFSRAARLIDMMERDGLLGPPQGSKPREVLVKADFFEEWDEARRGVEG